MVATGQHIRGFPRRDCFAIRSQPLSLEKIQQWGPTPIPGTSYGSHPDCTNSYSAEIVGLIAAHTLTPFSQDLIIKSDCRPALQVARAFATRSRRKQLQTNYHNLFRTLAALDAMRPSTTLEWVRAHVGIEGNEIADTLAKLGAAGSPAGGPRADSPPEYLPLNDLLAQSSLAVSVRITPCTLQQALPALTFTTALDNTSPPITPVGKYFPDLLSSFRKVAAQAFRATSAHGADWHTDQRDRAAACATLWAAGLQGRLASSAHRHASAHMIKLATGLAGSGLISTQFGNL